MNLQDQRVLITGATGNLGKQLVYECGRRGITPVAMVRKESNTQYIDSQKIEKRVADIRNQGEIEQVVQGIDVVIHTVAWVNFRQDKLTQFTGINTFGALDLYRACAKAGVKRFVQLSSVVTVGARPRTGETENNLVTEEWMYNLGHLNVPYVMTKRAADEELRKLASAGGPELVTVCPSITVAPSRTGDDRGKAAKLFSHWILPDLSNVVNLVDLRDVVPAILAAAERGRAGQKYLLTGENVVVRELALAVASKLGSRPHLVRLPRWFYLGAARTAVATNTLLGKNKISFYPDLVRLMDFDWAFSCAKARVELGFSPRPLAATIDDLLSNNFVGTWMKPAVK
jgi:dihydroflavonol-4-reductase